MSVDTRQLRRSVSGWAAQVHDDALDTMADNMRPYARRRSGELRDSIKHDKGRTVVTPSSVRGRIIAPVIQARTTDQGSPAHQIRPKRAGGLLVFYWPKTGRTMFLPRVSHPGNRPMPWWRRALNGTYGPALRYHALRTPMRRR